MTLRARLRRGLAATALALAAGATFAAPPAAATTDPADRAVTATWTGTGSAGPDWPVFPTIGDRYVSVSGTVTPVRGAPGTCSAWWLEDPSGVPYGAPIGLTAVLSCGGGVAGWSGGCVVTRYVTIELTCTPADGAIVQASLAVVPDAGPPFGGFTFAGTLTRTKPV
ncbi:MAG TPA: hypothetical protein VF519_17405 [Mycobacteriales bacterium]|jgi:hypothetical protein